MKQIDVLPNDVLLEIFDFYLTMDPLYAAATEIEPWRSLVHVCRRWRGLIFESPRRLNLQLLCTPVTSTRDKLDTWPALPLIVRGNLTSGLLSDMPVDNIIRALEQSNRVSQVTLWDLADWQLEEVSAAMQVPFPELTFLQLSSDDETQLVIPDSFLGGSAPRLQYFDLDRIPFPGLPTLLLSATHLVQLWLTNIPHSGYISPEAMVALLCASSSLEAVSLRFESPESRPDSQSRSLPPTNRSILPALAYFRFKGVNEYLEDVVTFIDAPQLKNMQIYFFNQINFDTRRLAQFINRTPELGKDDEVYVEFGNRSVHVLFMSLQIVIECREPERRLSSVAQVCNSFLPSTVEDLHIDHHDRHRRLVWKNDAIENTLWLQLLLPFTAVMNLYLYKEFAPSIAAALQELAGAGITEVLPSLQNIFVEKLELSGPFQENIGQFVAARQLSGRPIAIFVR